MSWRVFYSWQSDLPNRTNWGFIEEALERAAKAISRDVSVDVEPVIDRDTSGLTGAPEIAAAIFRKIEEAQVFACDVSIIGKAAMERPTPNPNVLIELGYALALDNLGWERVILVMNTAYGTPGDLPFDLRQRRVVTYHFEEATVDKGAVRNELAQKLERQIRGIIEMSNGTVVVPTLSAHEKAEQYLRLRDAVSRTLWYEAKDLLPGLSGYRDVDALDEEIRAECLKLDSLIDEAVDASANNEQVRLIRIGRVLGPNIPPALHESLKAAWEVLPLGNLRRVYRHHNSNAEATPISIGLTLDGRLAIVGFADHSVKVLNVQAGKEEQPSQGWVSEAEALAVMPDGRSVATPSHGYNVSRWDFRDGSPVGYYKLNRSRNDYGHVSSIAVTSDGTHLIVGHEDGAIRLWTVDPIGLPCRFQGHSERVNELAVLPDQRSLLSGSDDGTIRLWSLDQCVTPGHAEGRVNVVVDAQRIFRGHAAGVTTLAVTPDGKKVISAARNGTLMLWDVDTGRWVHPFGGFNGSAHCLATTPTGHEVLAGVDNGNIVIWDIARGSMLRLLTLGSEGGKGGEGAVTVLAITPDGRRVVFGTADGSINLLDFPDGLFSP